MCEENARYKALDISRYVINYYNNIDVEISNLKLQKVLYFVQGNFYKKFKKPCFIEDMLAWRYGPVIPIVYAEFKQFGANNISKVENILEYDIEKKQYIVREYSENLIEDIDRKLINDVLELCKEYSPVALYQITHKQKPWLESYKNGYNSVINKELIKDFFINANG
ncbi:MAG: Panacea domain-containing protein [Cellulosilyticaceae bacterium]